MTALALDPAWASLLASSLWVAVPVLGRFGSKPGMVLGLVTGILFSVLTVSLGPAVGLTGDSVLVVAVPAAFMLGFFVVGLFVGLARR